MKLQAATRSPERAEFGLRRRVGKKQTTPGDGFRMRKRGTAVGNSSAVATPTLKWKFYDRGIWVAGDDPPLTGRRRFFQGVIASRGREGSVSARKITAGLWQLRPPAQIQPSSSFPISAKKRATVSGRCKQSDGSCTKPLNDQRLTTVSVVSALQAELVAARSRIRKLQAERRSNRYIIELFLRKVDEEKRSWKRREEEKLCMVNELKGQLKKERKTGQRMHMVNSKLIHEVADVKLSAKLLLDEYLRERKSRELMEDVCQELAKEIAEDKAAVEAMKRESIKMHEEVAEERKMLQLAEVWREERVQMKLVDAKLTLERKYSQISKLMADFETFLGAANASSDAMELRRAGLIQQAANSVKIEDVCEFSYDAPKSCDIFSLVKDLQRAEMNEEDMEQCVHYHLDDNASKPCVVSPDGNGLYPNSLPKNSVCNTVRGSVLEEAAGSLKTVTRVGNLGQTFFPERIQRKKDKMQYPGTKINKVGLVTAKQFNHNASLSSANHT